MREESLQALADQLGCAGNFGITITGFSVDSRNVKLGDLFFALKGERVDGHDYLEQVAQNGAVAAVVNQEYQGSSHGLLLLPVKDVLEALHFLAKQRVSVCKPKIVAITGSVGKTTTKEFTTTLLEGAFRVGKTPGNANSQLGVPLTILNIEGSEEVLVLEMGMNQPNEISKLVQIAPPDIALITKIGVSHAAFFEKGIEGIAEAKGEIFSHPQTQIKIAHHSVTKYPSLNKDLLLFGEQGEYRLYQTPEGIVIEEKGDVSPPIQLPFNISHFVENFLAAVVIARQLGLEWELIKQRAALLTPYKMRFEKIERKGVIYINDAYNASPESMRAALANLPTPKQGGKRIAVFGEMKELGVYTHQAHLEIAQEALATVDHLLCIGEGCLSMVDVFSKALRPVEYFSERSQLISALRHLAKEGDVVLLKGSRSNYLWCLLDEMEER